MAESDGHAAQVNARKIYDEPNVLEGILSNRLFLIILGAEAALQVSLPGANPSGLRYAQCLSHARCVAPVVSLYCHICGPFQRRFVILLWPRPWLSVCIITPLAPPVYEQLHGSAGQKHF